MRGVNLGGWFSQVDCIQEKDPEGFVDLPTHIQTFLGPEDFERVKSWGFDHVRLPVDYFNVFEGPNLTPVQPILSLLDRAVDGLTAAGLDVILDLHKCPGHDFHEGCLGAQGFFTDPSKRKQAKHVWQHLAERYGARPKVLLEILNEPVAEDSASWDQVKHEMAAHIRRYAPDATLVVGSNRWSHPDEFARLTPLADDNVLYSFHFYASLLFTHQLAPWITSEVFRVRRPYPGTYSVPVGTVHRLPLDPGAWNRARMEQQLAQVFRFRERHRVAVACNEFGVYVGGADRGSQLAWMEDFLSTLEEHGIGFSYWNYKNLDFGLLSRGESLFTDYPQYQNPERVDTELVEILRGCRPSGAMHTSGVGLRAATSEDPAALAEGTD
jgi:aryl-phospho-beta-D-glucosidase BglC (GH1 family)